jgi:hypothetical protein
MRLVRRNTLMASALSASLYGGWGYSPQWGPGTKSLVGSRAKPPEANSISVE